MRCDENKKVFPLLVSSAIANIQNNRILVAICNEDMLCNRNLDLVELIPCIHEEADQRLCLHAKHSSKSCNLLFFETVNTDLVAIAVYNFLRLPKLSELWMEFRTGKTMEFIFVHEISKTFGPPVCNRLYVIF